MCSPLRMRLETCQGSTQVMEKMAGGEYPQSNDLKKYQRRMRIGSEGVVHCKARSHMQSDLERYKFFIEHHKNGARQTTLFDLENERPDLMPAHKNTDK